MSETDLESMRNMIQSCASQVQAMSAAIAPLQGMLEQIFDKMGIKVETNKIIYMKNKNTIIFGVKLIAPTREVAEQLVQILTGKKVGGMENEE
ncbi:MAG: hypothetical protein QXV82_09955 [Ignisphaera sp.]